MKKVEKNQKNNTEPRITFVFSPTYKQLLIIIGVVVILLLFFLVKPFEKNKFFDMSFFRRPSVTPTSTPVITPTPILILSDREEALDIYAKNYTECPPGGLVLDWLKSVIGKDVIASIEESEIAKKQNEILWACYIINGEEYHRNASSLVITQIPTPTLYDCQIARECGGGIKKMTLENCIDTVCCQIDNSWITTSKEACKKIKR